MTIRNANLRGAHILANAIVKEIKRTENFVLRCEYATCGELTIYGMKDACLIGSTVADRLVKRINGALR